MKMLLIAIFFVLTTSTLFSQDRIGFPNNIIYDPFYSIEVIDSDGNLYRLTSASFLTMSDQKKYFLWIRRGTERGIVTSQVDFNRIQKITFTGEFGTPEGSFTPATILLTDGSEHSDVFIGTDGYLGGFDEEFASFSRIMLSYNMVKSIEFIVDGTYKICPVCFTLYYDIEIELCPFHKAELLEQDF